MRGKQNTRFRIIEQKTISKGQRIKKKKKNSFQNSQINEPFSEIREFYSYFYCLIVSVEESVDKINSIVIYLVFKR